MNKQMETLLERVSTWSEEDQQELLAAAMEIELRRDGVYRLSDDERAAIRQGLAAADRGDFASDEEMKAFFDRSGA
jgi:predicted transcriptional regulator